MQHLIDEIYIVFNIQTKSKRLLRLIKNYICLVNKNRSHTTLNHIAHMTITTTATSKKSERNNKLTEL